MSKEKIAATLRAGAAEIEAGYWYRGNNGTNDEDSNEVFFVTAEGTYETNPPVCRGGCLMTSFIDDEGSNEFLEAAQSAIIEYFDAPGAIAVYRINDSQPVQEGRQWAIDTLHKIADAVEKAQ